MKRKLDPNAEKPPAKKRKIPRNSGVSPQLNLSPNELEIHAKEYVYKRLKGKNLERFELYRSTNFDPEHIASLVPARLSKHKHLLGKLIKEVIRSITI